MKPNGGTESKTEARFVFILDPLVDVRFIAANFLLEDGGQRSSGVFGIDVDAPGQHCLLANVSPRQIKAALHLQMRLRFNLLGQEFTEDQRLGKIL